MSQQLALGDGSDQDIYNGARRGMELASGRSIQKTGMSRTLRAGLPSIEIKMGGTPMDSCVPSTLVAVLTCCYEALPLCRKDKE